MAEGKYYTLESTKYNNKKQNQDLNDNNNQNGTKDE